MSKKIISYSIFFILFSLAGYYIHAEVCIEIANKAPFSLKNVYLFLGGFSLFLCISFSLLSTTQKFRDQLGFLYLISVGLKIILFCLVFYTPLFKSDSYTNIESVNLLIPILLILFLEVFFISKLLKNLPLLKNEE